MGGGGGLLLDFLMGKRHSATDQSFEASKRRSQRLVTCPRGSSGTVRESKWAADFKLKANLTKKTEITGAGRKVTGLETRQEKLYGPQGGHRDPHGKIPQPSQGGAGGNT